LALNTVSFQVHVLALIGLVAMTKSQLNTRRQYYDSIDAGSIPPPTSCNAVTSLRVHHSLAMRCPLARSQDKTEKLLLLR
jgi:hypothetical protein